MKLVEYGIQQGWSNEKIQAEVNRDLRGKGIEIENKDIVFIIKKSIKDTNNKELKKEIINIFNKLEKK